MKLDKLLYTKVPAALILIRLDYCMILGLLFLVIIGSGSFSADRFLFERDR